MNNKHYHKDMGNITGSERCGMTSFISRNHEVLQKWNGIWAASWRVEKSLPYEWVNSTVMSGVRHMVLHPRKEIMEKRVQSQGLVWGWVKTAVIQFKCYWKYSADNNARHRRAWLGARAGLSVLEHVLWRHRRDWKQRRPKNWEPERTVRKSNSILGEKCQPQDTSGKQLGMLGVAGKGIREKGGIPTPQGKRDANRPVRSAQNSSLSIHRYTQVCTGLVYILFKIGTHLY